ncbi:hypothetical protein GCM10007897_27740 [Sphingobium jiangsuense]|uniref:TonB family protein n=1 Tax=Sphingobium jiangsuense TaxID=870476 RepID=A0A7W6BJR8_9SPHN|nr:energy transducer TonB [Sphingobium jiangsuense]MBB3926282.1 TonB family protein [Sphingobium jiangsuense]GLT01381.1 hypothetical protein GCM10007897_27740 [Sphingobium jiangsuense]
MGVSHFLRWIDAVAAGVLMLAMTALAQASVPRPGQDEAVPLPSAGDVPGMPGKAAPPLPPRPRVRAVPAESPGNWMQPEDYPAAILALRGEGTSAFRLYVDEKGAVQQCWITAGSGIEMLDRATCALMKERARFRPARNARGQAVRDVYQNRVVWRLPPIDAEPFAEGGMHLVMAVDRVGASTSCFLTGRWTGAATGEEEDQQAEEEGGCPADLADIPARMALAARGYGPEDLRQVNLDLFTMIDRIRADEVYRGSPGAMTTGASVWRFGVDAGGTVRECALERQRGSELLLPDLCVPLLQRRFEPAPETAGAPAARNGWIVLLFSYKTGP